jgi:O-antigen biosynthesis protein
MKLSVIIVNYNVKYFLDQCLYSIFKSLNGIEGEVIVVDNNSVDGSEAMIRDKFPQVKLICNNENVGFSKANNQAIKLAQGEYVLCINPDTVIEESTLRICCDFMDSHPDAGGLGPKMIDGKGKYLPESKRGLPTPKVALYKILGLTKFFPESPVFARYYLGHLSKNEVNKIEILTGSFMFIRKSVLDQIGLFDETFFMYGEDIDLSYRILKAGYNNYYLPETTIIHYRGESTKKSTVNYVLIFYKAMKIFTEKHFSNNQAFIFSLLINIAINARAFLSIVKRAIIFFLPVCIDLLTFYAILTLTTVFWEKFYLQVYTYPPQFRHLLIPSYVLIWVLSLFISNAYTTPIKLKNALKGLLIGTILLFTLHALVPAELRFSRAIIVIGAIFILIVALFNRFILSLTKIREYTLVLKKNKRFAIVGYQEEAKRVKNILIKSGIIPQHIDFILPVDGETHSDFSCNITKLGEIVSLHSIDEVIFCAKDISTQDIISNMKILNPTGIDFKIASPESYSVVGSNSTRDAGDIYVIKIDETHLTN